MRVRARARERYFIHARHVVVVAIGVHGGAAGAHKDFSAPFPRVRCASGVSRGAGLTVAEAGMLAPRGTRKVAHTFVEDERPPLLSALGGRRQWAVASLDVLAVVRVPGAMHGTVRGLCVDPKNFHWDGAERLALGYRTLHTLRTLRTAAAAHSKESDPSVKAAFSQQACGVPPVAGGRLLEYVPALGDEDNGDKDCGGD
mmetsp:Transcript_8139/g.23976  ORF Transcript_8139/g.23976 Transcript_8139/m.23976 type:complete len:200 (-) Transcript_8139:111-710(-)